MERDKAGWAKRALAETGVIVLGVLIALWIDASWQYLQDRSEEQQVIADLEADFAENSEMLQYVTSRHAAFLEGYAKLVSSGPDAFTSTEIADVTRALMDNETFNASTGALDAALSSGRIGLIRDAALRASLAGWGHYLSEGTEEADVLMPNNLRLVEEVGAPLEPVLLNQLTMVGPAADKDYTIVDTAGARSVVRALYDSAPARALLVTKAAYLAAGVPEMVALREETDRILSVLRTQLHPDS